MYHKLMVPLDGSAFGEHALPLALTIARRAAATVNLVHVCVPPAPLDLIHLLHPDSEDISAQARGQLYLDHLAERLSPRWGVPITTTVLDGPIAPTLEEHALASGADLVVLTTHGRGALRRLALGSVADELVRSLPLPLLLTRPREEALDLLESTPEQTCQRVLIPLDGSTLAETILEPVVELGALFDAEYTLLQAIDPPMLGYALTAAPGIDDQALGEWREETLAYLGEIAERLRERQVRVEIDTVLGHPPTAILEYARRHAFELIALATHGRGGVARVLLGSTAEAIVRGSHTPVLVSRPVVKAQQRVETSHDAIAHVPG